MKKIVLLLSVTFVTGSLMACDCSASKNMMKCDYYVGLKHNKSHQQECVDFAKIKEKNSDYAIAARYYLFGGDLKKAETLSKKAVKIGQNYANEYLGIVYLLKNDLKNADASFKSLKEKDKNYMKKDIETISSMYDNFDKIKAMKLIGIN